VALKIDGTLGELFAKLQADLMSDMQEILTKSMGKFGSSFGTTGITGFDPYIVLGLTKDATDEQVKSRYRDLAKLLHPDTSPVKGTEFLFNIITVAQTLIDKQRKEKGGE